MPKTHAVWMVNINSHHIKHNKRIPKPHSFPYTKGLRQRCGLQMLPINYIQTILKNKSLVLVQLEASPTSREGKKSVYILGHIAFLSFSYSPFYFKLRHTHTHTINPNNTQFKDTHFTVTFNN